MATKIQIDAAISTINALFDDAASAATNARDLESVNHQRSTVLEIIDTMADFAGSDRDYVNVEVSLTVAEWQLFFERTSAQGIEGLLYRITAGLSSGEVSKAPRDDGDLCTKRVLIFKARTYQRLSIIGRIDRVISLGLARNL